MSGSERIRLAWIDTLRGMAMLLVVIAHTELGVSNWLYVFHVPLFFLISGILSGLTPRRPFAETIRRRAFSLLLPYLCFSLLGTACLALQAQLRHQTSLSSLLQDQLVALILALRGTSPFHGDLWFLPCLYVTELVHQLLSRTRLTHGAWLPALAATGFLLGLRPQSIFSAPLPWDLDLLSASLFFYAVGARLQARAWTGWLQERPWVLVPAGLGLVCLAHQINGRVDLYHGLIGNPFIYLLGALGGCLAMLCLAPSFVRFPWLAFLGRHTLPVLGLHHWYGFALASLLLKPFFSLLPSNGLLTEILHGVLLCCITLGMLTLGISLLSGTRTEPTAR